MKSIVSLSLGVAAIVLGAVSPLLAQLSLYDDFEVTAINENRWVVDAMGGTGAQVTLADGAIRLDLTSSSAGKYARLAFARPVRLTDDAPALRLTWDMNVLTSGLSGAKSYFNGLSIGVSKDTYVAVGQTGNNPEFAYQFFTRSQANQSAQLDGVNHGHGSDLFHYDYTVSPDRQTLKVYAVNPQWASTPQKYESATPLWTRETSFFLPMDRDLQVIFYVELKDGVDSTSRRSVVTLDSIYSTFRPDAAKPTGVMVDR